MLRIAEGSGSLLKVAARCGFQSLKRCLSLLLQHVWGEAYTEDKLLEAIKHGEQQSVDELRTDSAVFDLTLLSSLCHPP